MSSRQRLLSPYRHLWEVQGNRRHRTEKVPLLGPAQPRRKGQVAMYLDGQWYSLDLSAAAPQDDSRASTLDVAPLTVRLAFYSSLHLS